MVLFVWTILVSNLFTVSCIDWSCMMARVKGLERKGSRRLRRALRSSNPINIQTSSESQPQPQELEPHLQEPIQQPQNPQFHCEVCDKSYANISSLNAHKKKHDGRRWKCEFCDKDGIVFVSKFAYLRHLSRSHQLRQVRERADNADEMEVYVSEGETAHMTQHAKDVLIERLRKSLARKTKMVKNVKKENQKLKKKIKQLLSRRSETSSTE